MSVVATSTQFKENAHEALTNDRLQKAMSFSRNFVDRRAAAAARLPEFEALRDSARAIKDHTLAHLDLYLDVYEQKVRASGGQVHYAQDAEEARKIIIDLCKSMGAKSATKGKSMIAEEIGLNAALEAAGIEPIETDLGEYIIQLRGETPSHIIAPAIHLTAKDVEQEFRKAHGDLLPERSLAEPEQLLAEARGVLRAKFLSADVGITGANFLVAETGTSIIVTNEGNGDLTQTCPRRISSSPPLKKSSRRSRTQPSSCACWRARRPARTLRSIRRFRPDRVGLAIPTVREPTMSSFSTMAARLCWAASSSPCCVASAAARA